MFLLDFSDSLFWVLFALPFCLYLVWIGCLESALKEKKEVKLWKMGLLFSVSTDVGFFFSEIEFFFFQSYWGPLVMEMFIVPIID